METAVILRPSGISALLGFILVAGVVQILATLALGLAPLEAQLVAQREPWGPYTFGLVLGAGGLLLLWVLRHRLLLGLALFLVAEALVMLGLGPRTSVLGWASYSEVIAHHFITIVAFVVCLRLAAHWWTSSREHKSGKLAAVATATGSSVLIVLHLLAGVGSAQHELASLAESIGALLWLAAGVALIVTRWSALRGYRVAAIAVLAPYVARLALATPFGSVEALVPTGRVEVLMLAMVVAIVGLTAQVRPRNPLSVRFLSWVLAALAVSLIYVLYHRVFGELDDAILGLAQSLLGFSPPYPGYVATWKLVVVLVACFSLLRLVYGALLETSSRTAGTSLGIIAVAGVGLTDPQLSLMAATGVLGLLEALTYAERPATSARRGRPPIDLTPVLEALSTRLDWAAPVVLHDTKGDVIRVRGEQRGLPVELRARSGAGGTWTARVQVGLIGRDRAPLQIDPAPRGDYAIGLRHQAKGDRRLLESLDDELAAILEFAPTASLKRWPGGVLVELGDDLETIDAALLQRMIAVLVRWLEER